MGSPNLKAERYDESAAVFQRARDLALRLKNPTAEATAVGGLAGIAFARNRHRTAVRLYRRAVALSEAAGDWTHAAEDLGALIESLSALGRLEEVEHEAQRLVDLATNPSCSACP